MVDTLADKQAEDIVLLDVRAITPIADYFIICTATSERMTRALANAIRENTRPHALYPLSVEGTPESGWVLVDMNSVIIHIFGAEERDYYRLEEVWQSAPVVLKMV